MRRSKLLHRAGASRHCRTARLLPALMLGAASVGGLSSGNTSAAPPPGRLDKDIVVTAPRLADATMAAQVMTALQEHPYIFVDHVTVTVENGIVRVAGVVQDLSDLHAVLKVARRIAGRGRVVNAIEYQPVDDDGN